MAIEHHEANPSAAGDAPQRNQPAPVDPGGNGRAEPDGQAKDDRAPRSGHRGRRWLLVGLGVALVVVLALVYGRPWLEHSLNYVSTDDAFVNGHLTMVGARIPDTIVQVLVDDNDYVQAGTPLVRLDPQPYRLAVDEKRAALVRAKLEIDRQVAALEAARAELEGARDQVRAQLASLRGGWFLIETVQTLIRYQVAALQASVANLKLQEANLDLARIEYQRVVALVKQRAATPEELDQRWAALQVARAQVAAAGETAQQTRALLGLKPNREHPGAVPKDVEQVFPGMQYALAGSEQTLAQLGVPFNLLGMQPVHLKERLHDLASESLPGRVPAVRAAEARVREALAALGGSRFDPAKPYNNPAVIQARKALEQADLQLSYTEIRAPIAGFVSRRTVNPGNQVQAGQTLMVIRPLNDVWIDANFKETQLHDLRIGQPVDLEVDAYPGRVFHGRVAGFSAGTGASLSLLPPENASGNYVKVVQRLPVRIELTEPNPPETPLFVGLSVVPDVNVKARPTGPGAGQRLRSPAARVSPRH